MSDDPVDDLAGLAATARRAAVPGGFGWLDDALDPGPPLELWITCRMTHVLALEQRRTGGDGPAGDADRAAAQHGVDALLDGPLRDPDHGGWHGLVAGPGEPAARKEAYGHAFVVLAGASALAAGLDRGEELVRAGLAAVDAHFWHPGDRMPVEAWDTAFTTPDPYRGVNATMHLVEAYLAAHDALGGADGSDGADGADLLGRAEAMTRRVVQGWAREFGQRLPEHFDERWRPRPELHRDRPDDRFRPYGVTVGHLLEWARLAVHLRRALARTPGASAGSEDLLPDAVALVDRAVADGWAADGTPGFVYTTDFDGRPVVRQRFHWVLAEALGAATVLGQETGDRRYADLHAAWTAWAEAHLVVRGPGGLVSWRHEVAPDGRPAAEVWVGRPDVYHAYQALLLPRIAPGVSFAGPLARS